MSLASSCIHDSKWLEPSGATSTEPDAHLILTCALCSAVSEARSEFEADLRIVRSALVAFLEAFGGAMAPLGRSERDLDTALTAVLDDGDTDGEMLRAAGKAFVEAWVAACAPVHAAQFALDSALSSVFQSLPRGEG